MIIVPFLYASVDLEPIFNFLDDNADGSVSQTELNALTTTGDADGKKSYTIRIELRKTFGAEGRNCFD